MLLKNVGPNRAGGANRIPRNFKQLFVLGKPCRGKSLARLQAQLARNDAVRLEPAPLLRYCCSEASARGVRQLVQPGRVRSCSSSPKSGQGQGPVEFAKALG